MKKVWSFVDIHRSSLVLDAHCDTLTVLKSQGRNLGQKSQIGHVDLPRMLLGGVNMQFFAAFIEPLYKDNPLARAIEIFDCFYEEMSLNKEIIEPVFCSLDIEKALTHGKIAALLTVEGGEALMGRLEVLRIFYRLGVRCLTLTWNGRNELADGVSESNTGGGLTVFGKEVIGEMNRLGMVIDVSHLSSQGFWDVMSHSSQPVIASHSNCSAICEHPRNLEDKQIEALAKKGGVVGLTFYSPFVHTKKPSLEAWLDHVEHLAMVAGVDCIGIGSDFDGMDEVISGLRDISDFPLVTEGLLQRGFSEKDVKKILGGNFLRVLKQVLG